MLIAFAIRLTEPAPDAVASPPALQLHPPPPVKISLVPTLGVGKTWLPKALSGRYPQFAASVVLAVGVAMRDPLCRPPHTRHPPAPPQRGDLGEGDVLGRSARRHRQAVCAASPSPRQVADGCPARVLGRHRPQHGWPWATSSPQSTKSWHCLARRHGDSSRVDPVLVYRPTRSPIPIWPTKG